MPADYSILAPIYDSIGMAAFAEVYTPQLVVYAQTQDWLGRHILDLGCGTGAATRWLANHSYNVTSIDSSTEMLTAARSSFNSSGLSVQWMQGDIRALDTSIGAQFDMAFALDVLNEVNNLRDLEHIFNGVNTILDAGKLFIFDLHTIQGLAAQGEESAEMAAETNDLVVTIKHQFDYERQARTSQYFIFQRKNQVWERSNAQRGLRGFPLQAVAALLQRANFGIMSLLDLKFNAVDPVNVHDQRVIFIARKTGGS